MKSEIKSMAGLRFEITMWSVCDLKKTIMILNDETSESHQ